MRTLINFFVRVLESMLLRFRVSLRRRSAASLVGCYSPARAFASANRLGELLLSFARLASANFYPPARALLRRTATLLRAPCFGVLLRDPSVRALFCCAHLLAVYCYVILVLERFSATLILCGVLLRDPCAPALFCCAHLLVALLCVVAAFLLNTSFVVALLWICFLHGRSSLQQVLMWRRLFL